MGLRNELPPHLGQLTDQEMHYLNSTIDRLDAAIGRVERSVEALKEESQVAPLLSVRPFATIGPEDRVNMGVRGGIVRWGPVGGAIETSITAWKTPDLNTFQTAIPVFPAQQHRDVFTDVDFGNSTAGSPLAVKLATVVPKNFRGWDTVAVRLYYFVTATGLGKDLDVTALLLDPIDGSSTVMDSNAYTPSAGVVTTPFWDYVTFTANQMKRVTSPDHMIRLDVTFDPGNFTFFRLRLGPLEINWR